MTQRQFDLHVIELLLDIDADLERLQSNGNVRAPGFKKRVNDLRDKLTDSELGKGEAS